MGASSRLACRALALVTFLFVATLAEKASGAVASDPNPPRARAREAAWETSVEEEVPDTAYDDYRLTLLGLDVAAVSMTIAGVALDESDIEGPWPYLIVAGVGTYALGSPIVHLAHDQPSRSLGSVGLRVGVPGVGLLIALGAAGSCGSSDVGCYGAAIFGGVALVGGVLTAMIVDDAFLGKVPIEKQGDAAVRARSFELAMSPFFDLEKGTLGLTLVGAF